MSNPLTLFWIAYAVIYATAAPFWLKRHGDVDERWIDYTFNRGLGALSLAGILGFAYLFVSRGMPSQAWAYSFSLLALHFFFCLVRIFLRHISGC